MISHRTKPSHQQGFSLVELAVVLVILGVLAAGILTGNSLLKAAELRAIPVEFRNFQTAIEAFKTKYHWIPGDIPNATDYWGVHPNCGNTFSAAAGTCNGDSNAEINNPDGNGESGERFMMWQHLAFAGFIEGSYSGFAGDGHHDHSIPLAANNNRSNIPASDYEGAAWGVESTWATGDSDRYERVYGNALKLGAAEIDGEVDDPILTPEAAWNIDKKLDDGLPGAGNIVVRHWQPCTLSANFTDYGAGYELTNPSPDCGLYFIEVVH